MKGVELELTRRRVVLKERVGVGIHAETAIVMVIVMVTMVMERFLPTPVLFMPMVCEEEDSLGNANVC